jgi:hypothetical protein
MEYTVLRIKAVFIYLPYAVILTVHMFQGPLWGGTSVFSAKDAWSLRMNENI